MNKKWHTFVRNQGVRNVSKISEILNLEAKISRLKIRNLNFARIYGYHDFAKDFRSVLQDFKFVVDPYKEYWGCNDITPRPSMAAYLL